jgi:hypothetical protein
VIAAGQLNIAISSNSTCSICCGFGVQLVVQEIHNKSNKWSLSFSINRFMPRPGRLKQIPKLHFGWNFSAFACMVATIFEGNLG